MRDLMECGEIDRNEAERLLCCCVNGGPAFVIGTVGARLLGDAYKGVLLYAANVAASFLIALLLRRHPTEKKQNIPPVRLISLSGVFPAAVERAVTAVLGMSGYVLLFSAVLTLSDAVTGSFVMPSAFTIRFDPKPIFAAFWEVSCGCVELATCPLAGVGRAFSLGAAIGWGGLSVSAQIRGMFAEYALPRGKYYAARALHALLGGGLSAVLFAVMPMPRQTAAVVAPLYTVETVYPFSVSAAASAALLVLCGGILLCMARE
ncbi:MAG: hypothetical protein E7552_05990 [Ruminococcaceae bacterium]|nr:hypothetical protein [Oscillospiraceae bacterium]